MIRKDKNVRTTNHAKKRAKERMGLGKNSIDRIAQKAFLYGIKHSDVKGSLKKYIDSLYLNHRKSNNTRIYNRKVYLFHNDVLITVLNLPNNFNELADKLQKQINEQNDKRVDEVESL